MRKYWRIKNDSDIKKKLKYLNIPCYYIKILLEKDSSMMKYLEKYKYVYISYVEFENNFDQSRWRWQEYNHYNEKILQNNGFKYVGEINLRKEKLIKIKSYENTKSI